MQKRLIALRRARGVTQKEMADVIGIEWRTYVNKEKGVTQFKANEMFAIASFFDEDIGKIFLPTNFTKHEVKGDLKGVL